MKNEFKLGGLYGAYETKKQAVEDLTDKWISALRRKATIKRKQVCLLRHARCSVASAALRGACLGAVLRKLMALA